MQTKLLCTTVHVLASPMRRWKGPDEFQKALLAKGLHPAQSGLYKCRTQMKYNFILFLFFDSFSLPWFIYHHAFSFLHLRWHQFSILDSVLRKTNE